MPRRTNPPKLPKDAINVLCTKCGKWYDRSPWQIKKQSYVCGKCKARMEVNRIKRWAEKGVLLRSIYNKKACRPRNPVTTEQARKYRQKYDSNPDNYIKRKARWTVHNAIRSGKLTKKPCEVCGDKESHAHHDDYSKPLDVKWRCRKHHLDEHGGVLCKHKPIQEMGE